MKSKRSSKSKTVDDMVSKVLADNFKGWGQLDTDGRTVDGLTLRQRLVLDKEQSKVKGKSIAFGAHYYRALKDKYAPSSSPSQLLYVKHTTDEVSPVLTMAVAAYKRLNSAKSLLAEYMHTATSINQKEFVGLSRCILGLRPSASMGPLQLVLDYMRFIVRLKLKVCAGPGSRQRGNRPCDWRSILGVRLVAQPKRRVRSVIGPGFHEHRVSMPR